MYVATPFLEKKKMWLFIRTVMLSSLIGMLITYVLSGWDLKHLRVHFFAMN